jgi:hypothetical protein
LSWLGHLELLLDVEDIEGFRQLTLDFFGNLRNVVFTVNTTGIATI